MNPDKETTGEFRIEFSKVFIKRQAIMLAFFFNMQGVVPGQLYTGICRQ